MKMTGFIWSYLFGCKVGSFSFQNNFRILDPIRQIQIFRIIFGREKI